MVRCRDVARLLQKLNLSLIRLGTLLTASSEWHSTTCLHATYKLQSEHRVMVKDISVKNTPYVLSLLTSVTCFVSFY